MIAQKTENRASIQGQKGSSCPRPRALLSLWRWPRHRPANLLTPAIWQVVRRRPEPNARPWPLKRPVRHQRRIDQHSLVVHPARPAGHENDLRVVRAEQLQVVFVHLARTGHPVNKFHIVSSDKDVHRVLLYQFSNFRKTPEDAALAGDITLKVSEKPAASLLPGRRGCPGSGTLAGFRDRVSRALQRSNSR